MESYQGIIFTGRLTHPQRHGKIAIQSMRGRAAVARQAHNLKVVGSNPTPAT